MERQPGVLLRLRREAQQDTDHDEKQRAERDGEPEGSFLAVPHLVARRVSLALFLIFAGARLVAPGLHLRCDRARRRLARAARRL